MQPVSYTYQPSTNPANYRYGYQGQFAEKDRETGFNHFELRDYDSRIGRWFAPDPYHQFISPYTGMGNNPIFHIDPSGGYCPESYYSKMKNIREAIKNISRNRNAMYEYWMQNHTSGGQSMNLASESGMVNATCTTSEGDVIWVEGYVQALEYTAIKGDNYRSQGGQLYRKTGYENVPVASCYEGTDTPKEIGVKSVAVWEEVGGDYNNFGGDKLVDKSNMNLWEGFDLSENQVSNLNKALIGSNYWGASAITIDGGIVVAGSELVEFGAVMVLKGNDAGKVRYYSEHAGGAGTDASVGIEITRLDYTGDINNFGIVILKEFDIKYTLEYPVVLFGIYQVVLACKYHIYLMKMHSSWVYLNR